MSTVRPIFISCALLLTSASALAQDYTTVIPFWGDGVETLGSTSDLAVDDFGNVYVCGYSKSNVFRWSESGGIELILDKSGDGQGETLDYPWAMDTDAAGNLYVAGLYSDNLFKVAADGAISLLMTSAGDGQGNPFNGPRGIVAAPDGTVFVATQDPLLYRIDPDGSTSVLLASDSQDPAKNYQGASGESLALDAAGNLYATSSNDRVFQVTPAGEISVVIGAEDGLESPSAVAVDGADILYVTMPSYNDGRDRVFRRRPTGEVEVIFDADTPALLDSEADELFGLAATNDGTLYLSFIETNTVFELRPTGGLSRVQPAPAGQGGFSSSIRRRLDLGPDGELYVLMSDSVLRITPPSGWSDLGGGLDGATPAPRHDGNGPLGNWEEFQLVLNDGEVGASAALVLGVDVLDAPFKGGTLVPAPLKIVLGLTVDVRGQIAVDGIWPAGLPEGLRLVTQFWLQDASGPAGYVASNAISAEQL